MFFTMCHKVSRGVESNQRGLSLIELMIALLLSTLLTLGILTMYLDSTKTSRISQSLARVQESGRIALDMIARDLRMTGFAGCADPFQDLAPAFNASTLDPDFFGHSLMAARVDGNGWDNFVANAGIGSLGDAAVAASDALQVRRASGPFVTLNADMTGADSTISTDSDQTVSEFGGGDNAFITNCVNADVFAVGDPDGAQDNEINHGALSMAYPEGSRVFHFNSAVYWVGNTGRIDQRGNAVWALYQNGLEVVTGVERLQLLFGVRMDNGNVRFESADALASDDWDAVDVVRVGVLVSDDQGVLDNADNKMYDLPGTTVGPTGTAGADGTYPDDRRLRTTFTMTVNLRNQIED